MSPASHSTAPRLRYHLDAYQFVFDSLHRAQRELKRPSSSELDDEERAHITGPQLLHGVRKLGLERFGLLAKNVFAFWGVRSTDDFGRIVFEMIERGDMRKTDRDQLSDFFEVYDFDQALDRDYTIEL